MLRSIIDKMKRSGPGGPTFMDPMKYHEVRMMANHVSWGQIDSGQTEGLTNNPGMMIVVKLVL